MGANFNRKRITVGISFVGLLVLVFISYQFYLLIGPRQAHYVWTKHTELSNEKLGDIALYQNINSINPPPIPEHSTDLYDYFAVQSGKVATKKGDDKVIRISSEKSRTSKGIGVGQSREEVIAAYGSDFYKRSEQGFSIIGYVDKNLHYTLEFWFVENFVVNIRLDIAEMD